MTNEELIDNSRTSVYRDDEAFKNLEKVKHAWMESGLAAALDVPEPRQIEDYSGKVLVRMPRSLHRRLFEQSAAEQVSLNQYIVSLLSYGTGSNRAFTTTAQVTQAARRATLEKLRENLRDLASQVSIWREL
jgi:hypothetical protein